MSELAKAHAEIARLNRIVNSGDTLRDHAIRKAMQERDRLLLEAKQASAAWSEDCREKERLAARLADAEDALRMIATYKADDGQCDNGYSPGHIARTYFAPDSASACEHSNPEPWKLADGRAGWRCESCGAEFRLTDDGAITMNADQPEAAAK